MTVLVKDSLRASVEAATGGQVTVLYNTAGQPNYMNIIPKFNLQDIDASLGEGVHPAFIVNGVEKNEIFIGQYPGLLHEGALLSLPNVIPTNNADFDTFMSWANANGPGWHMMTNAEWMAIALWCWKNGTLPRGNGRFGQDLHARWETGRRADGGTVGEVCGDARTYTGSGPASWRHNGQFSGIADLNGNLWEWLGGYRLWEGEIQVLPNNDAADQSNDHGSASSLWQAIRAADGALVAPGSTGTLKYDGQSAGHTGHCGAPVLSDAIEHRNGAQGENSHADANNKPGYVSSEFKHLPVKNGLNVPAIAKTLGVAPIETNVGREWLVVRNFGERMPMVGGCFHTACAGGGFYGGSFHPAFAQEVETGMFARLFNASRSNAASLIGARVAYVSL